MKYIIVITVILYDNNDIKIDVNSERSGLDRYGFVYSEVDWEKGTQDEQSFF